MATLRITGGRLNGMSISVLPGDVARYTSSKVRQAIFNMLGSVEGMSVLDLFAGSGSFSIEALSRGAASATLVEANGRMTDLIGKNLSKTALNKYCQVFHMDVRYAVPLLYGRKRVYDIIFMDPPYEMGYVAQAMALLETHPLYTAHTITIAEYSRRENDSLSLFEGFPGAKTRKYGDTVISIFRRIRDSGA
jgi:16S rRNA (guanine(966)-N(2))-methyltransferase RsmD